MLSSVFIIRGQPGRWEGIVLDSGLAVAGSSFAQVQRCLGDIVPAPRSVDGASTSVGLALQRLAGRVRRAEFLAGHFSLSLQRRLGLRRSPRESHLIRRPD